MRVYSIPTVEPVSITVLSSFFSDSSACAPAAARQSDDSSSTRVVRTEMQRERVRMTHSRRDMTVLLVP
jgi:hypothetical protein